MRQVMQRGQSQLARERVAAKRFVIGYIFAIKEFVLYINISFVSNFLRVKIFFVSK